MKNSKKILYDRQGQSIVEYIILVAVVIAALFIFLGPGGMFRTTYNGVVEQQGRDMADVAKKIFF